MAKLAIRLVVILTAVAVSFAGLAMPAQAAAPAPPVFASSAPAKPSIRPPAHKIDVDFHWTSATVWYSKSETQRIVATNGACSVVVGKVPGWIAKILSGSCGLIAVWAGYALARGRCVGVEVSYVMAVPYDWKTRAC